MAANPNNSVSLQLISDRSSLADAIEQDGDITLEQVHFLNAPGAWRTRSTSFDITLLDLSANGNTTDGAIRHIKELKEQNPAHAVIVVGTNDQLASLLESDAQPLLYRVFSNSHSTRQILSAIRSAGELHRELAGKPKIPRNVKTNLGGRDRTANDSSADIPQAPKNSSLAPGEGEDEQKPPVIAKLTSMVASKVKAKSNSTDKAKGAVEPAGKKQSGKTAGENQSVTPVPPVVQEDPAAETIAADTVTPIDKFRNVVGKLAPKGEKTSEAKKPAISNARDSATPSKADNKATFLPDIPSVAPAPTDEDDTDDSHLETIDLLTDDDDYSEPEKPVSEPYIDDGFFSKPAADVTPEVTPEPLLVEPRESPAFKIEDVPDDKLNKDVLRDAPDDTTTADSSDRPPKSTIRMPRVDMSREALDRQDSVIRKIPFLIFATVGMPSLALLAYLALGLHSGEQGEDATLLTKQASKTSQDSGNTTSSQVSGTAAPAAETQASTAQNATNQQAESTQQVESPDATGAEGGEIAKTLVDSIKTVGKKVAEVVTENTGGNGSAVEANAPPVDNASPDQLLKWAKAAEVEARLYQPKEGNALFYYETLLARSAANTEAKNGRVRVLGRIEKNLGKQLRERNFVDASDTLERFEYSHPGHPTNGRLLAIVRSAVNREVSLVRNDPLADIDATVDLLNSLGTKFVKQRDSLLKLKKERAVLADIDKAIEAGIYLPPDRRNAFDRILQARDGRLVNSDDLSSRALVVSHYLYAQAEAHIAASDPKAAQNTIKAMEILNVDQAGITQLRSALKRGAVQVGETTETASTNSVQTSPEDAPKKPNQFGKEFGEAIVGQQQSDSSSEGTITEARVLQIVEPKYPPRARDLQLEGWVELSFVVDETGRLQNLKVSNEEPAAVFTDAAIEAIGQWRFQPAQDTASGASVASNFSVRLDFSLQQ